MGLLDDAIREHLDLKRKRGSDPEEIERLERESLGPVRREPAGMRAAAESPRSAAVDFEDEAPLYEDRLGDAPAASAAQSSADFGDGAHDDPPPFDEQATAMHTLDAAPDQIDYEQDEPQQRRGFFGRRRKSAPEPSDEVVAPAEPRRVQAEPMERPPAPREPDFQEPFEPVDEHHDELAATPVSGSESLDEPAPPPVAFEAEPPKRPHFADLPSAAAVGPTAPEPTESPERDQTEGPAPAPDSPAADDWSEETQLFDVPKHFASEDKAPEEAAPKDAVPDEDPLEETPEFLQDTPDHDRLWFEQKPPRDFDFDG